MNNGIKNSILILLFLCLSGVVPARAQAQEKVTLKVLCYNLRFGELATLEQLADYIKSEDPDVVALQEVDVLTRRERAPHQNGLNFISELAYRTGMLSLYGKTIPYAGGYYGIGILTKYPYISSERILLPMPEGAREQRALLTSEIELPGGGTFIFACTHLDYTLPKVRQAQVECLNGVLLSSDKPVVLCGDFNATPESREIARDMGAWLQTTGPKFTIPANAPASKIDYIFCYPPDRWTVQETHTPDVQLSDHLPVVSTLILSPEK